MIIIPGTKQRSLNVLFPTQTGSPGRAGNSLGAIAKSPSPQSSHPMVSRLSDCKIILIKTIKAHTHWADVPSAVNHWQESADSSQFKNIKHV